MVEKIKSLFPKRIYTYEDFSLEVKNYIFKKVLIIPLFIVVAFFFGFIVRNSLPIYNSIIIWCSPIIYIVYVYHLYNIFSCKQFIVLEGTVNEVEKNRRNITRNTYIYGKNYMTVECDGKNFEMDIRYVDNFKEGNIVKIYTKKSDFTFYSDETFKLNPLLICLVKNKESEYPSYGAEDSSENTTYVDADVVAINDNYSEKSQN